MESSLLVSLNRSVRGMQYAQTAISIRSSNIAHANDPNYTRREVLPPVTGPDVPGLGRFRDAFVDDQYRVANGALGEADVRQNVLGKVEDVFGDPVNSGLGRSMDQFFTSWKSLSENPADGVTRLQVLSAGRAFAQQVRDTYTKLDSIEQTIDGELSSHVTEVNTALQGVFDLNKRISALERNKMDSAELQDQRDHNLDQLAKLTGAQAIRQEDGTVRVIVGSTPVVDGPTVLKLQLVNSANGPVPAWDSASVPAYTGRGAVGGLVSIRDGEIAQLKQYVDTLGRTVATQVNTVHAAGFGSDDSTNHEFFKIGPGPADIVVNPDLRPEQLAAAETAGGGPAQGNNAVKLSQIADSPILNSMAMPGQSRSPAAAYRDLIGWIGSKAQEAQQQKGLATAHVQVNEQARQSEWGVSLDEEVANLTLQQKAFAASARVISVMDDLLDTLINRTGR